MPSSAGPNTAGESNLVFAYDTGDIINSYKGEPTVNLATTLDLYPQGGSLTLQTSTPGNVYLTNNAGANLNGQPFYLQVTTPSTYNNGGFTSSTNFNLPGGSTYLWLSFYVYLAQTYSGGNGPLGGYIAFKNSGGTEIGTSGWTFFINGVQNQNWSGDSANIGRWIRIDARSSITGGASGVTRWYVYNDLLTQGKMYVAQIQFTQNDHPVQYVNGTRSVTQGLVSLATPSTIDLTDVSFDSAAQMTFDGTNDKIYGIDSIVSYLSSSAIEFIVTPTTVNKRMTVGGYRQNDGYSQPTIGMVYIQNDNTFNAQVITTTQVYRGVTSTTTIAANKTYHVVFNKDTSVGLMQLYVNGVLESSQTFDPTTYAQWPTTGSYIGSNLLDLGKSNNTNAGQGWSGDFLAGKIPIFKLYSKTLSPSEVAQNYLAYKSRFNLA